MQAITASQTVVSAPKVASRNLTSRRTTKALAPRCVHFTNRVSLTHSRAF